MISYDILRNALEKNNWIIFIETLKPKYFPRDDKGNLIDRRVLAKVAETLTVPRANIPDDVKIVLLKCLLNSCVDGFTYEECPKNNPDLSRDHCHELYRSLNAPDFPNLNKGRFPYDGIIGWAVDYILKNPSHSDNSINRTEILRLSVQFLCNLSAFALKDENFPRSLNSDDFKSSIITLAGSDNIPLGRAACAYVHNALKNLPENYYDETQLREMARALIESDERGINSARESLIYLSKKPNWLRTIYPDSSASSKLRLLEIVHQDLRESVYSESSAETSTNFPLEVVEFLSDRFKKRSDLILKTVDSYLDDMEPTEVTSLLDTICVISSEDSNECHFLQNDRSLVINCIFLLKSLHLVGKASENHFTPVQKLSELAPCDRGAEEAPRDKSIQDHPAFGFKAALIRAIGNLVHKHQGNQRLVRETDAIPLLLDCCNIDARNPRLNYCQPVIIQWATFALRNLCENNPENQAIIRNCNRVGIVDNAIVREMGITLNEGEDGQAVGILPLPRNK